MGVDTSQYGVDTVEHRDVPDWDRDENSIFRGDSRPPEEIRADGGFRPPYTSRPDWQSHPERQVADIAQHTGGGTNAFVSTSTDRAVAEDFAVGRYTYVINAPGGIYTDPTLQQKTGKESHGEREVLFPGGIDWRYVQGWHKMQYDPGIHDYVAGEFVPNPDYIGDKVGPNSTPQPDQRPAQPTGPPNQQAAAPTRPDQAGPPADQYGSPTADPIQQRTEPRHQADPPAQRQDFASRLNPQTDGQPAAAPGERHQHDRAGRPGQQAGGVGEQGRHAAEPGERHQQVAGRQDRSHWPSQQADQRSQPGQPARNADGLGQRHDQPGQAVDQHERPGPSPNGAEHDAGRHQNTDQQAQHDDQQAQHNDRQARHDDQQGQHGAPEAQRAGRPDGYGPSTQDASRTSDHSGQTSLIAQRLSGEPPPGLGDRMGRLADPRLDALRPYLRSTEGGMSAFAPPRSESGQWAHRNEMYTARQVPRIPGQFVVDMHGSPDGMRIGETRLSEKDVADLIRANPDWDGGPVTLFGCKTGDGFAARVSQELGVPVTAPNSDAWVDHNGNVFASSQEFNPDRSKPAKPSWPPNGVWTTHTPHGEPTVHSGPFPPGHTPDWGNGTPSRPAGTAAHRGDETGPGDAPASRDDGVTPDHWDSDDPADVMQQMVDEKLTATWANFQYQEREFQDWCESPVDRPLPEIRPETRINCWEMTMYAAVVSGQLSHADCHRIYQVADTEDGRGEWFDALPDRLAPERAGYDPGGPSPERGQLVFWNGASHVAMATGRMVNVDPNDPESPLSPEVYTFWPPPDKEFTRTPEGLATQDKVKTSTIQGLVAAMARMKISPVDVTVGTPVWAGEP
ncbi:hypothetical protein [Actinocrispum sp. NPDC049592]|uniref:scabin-related ADP-ribosyltransferase n=1 Tax=Actinocrispum sp. NPDC049592 TaxID=3154835 RepID=UPI00342BC386